MWIAWRVGLAEEREVIRIARIMGMNRFEAAGRCMKVWEYADAHTTDGTLQNMSVSELSDAVSMAGFCEAMRDVRWLFEGDDVIIFPNFQRWNGTTAKARLQKNNRQSKWRASTNAST